MKAQFILAALEAMKEAGDALHRIHANPLETPEAWRLADKLEKARIQLKVHSGISDTEIKVEATSG